MTSRARTFIGSTFATSTSILKAVRLISSAFMIFALAFVILIPTWSSPFVLDDLTKIMENNDLRTSFKIGNFIYPYAENVTHFRNDPSRPLTFMIFWAGWNWGGGSPQAFHVINTVIHGLNGVLVLWLSYLLLPSLAVAVTAAALFASSPILIGTAAYVYGLSDLLCAFFILAALLCFCGRRAHWIPGVVLYILALASKQSAIVLPALVLLLDLFTGKVREHSRRAGYVALTVLSALYLLARWLYFGGIGDLEGLNETLPTLQYASTQGVSVLKYIAQIFAPVMLSIDHQPMPGEYPFSVYLIAWAVVMGLTVFAIRRPRQGAALAWIFFLICVLPTSSLFPTVDLYVERRAYLAAIGVFIALAIWLWTRWPKAAAYVAAVLVTAQSVIALERVQVYGDPERLWKESLQLNSNNPRALINLGVHYSASERWDESRETFNRLLTIQPENGSIYSKLAYIYMQKNYAGHDFTKARQLFEKSLGMSPSNIFALYNFGVLDLETGNPASAESHFAKAGQLAPQMTRAWLAAGKAAQMQNKSTEAVIYFERALAIDPSLEEAKQLLQQVKR